MRTLRIFGQIIGVGDKTLETISYRLAQWQYNRQIEFHAEVLYKYLLTRISFPVDKVLSPVAPFVGLNDTVSVAPFVGLDCTASVAP